MSATFDTTTKAAYDAASTAQLRAEAIVASLSGTVSVKVFDGTDTEMGSGTMAAPWAMATAGAVVLGEVSSFTVGTTATPDANWYIRFQNADVSRWARGSFGLSSSSQDFTWSLPAWTATDTGTIGTATINCTGNVAPVFSVAPTTASIAATGGTIQFTATDPEGGSVFYSLTTTRAGITIDATGLVTVTAAAAGTSGNIVVQASDGILTSTATCDVTVAESFTRSVWFTGNFESGQMLSYTGRTDAFYCGTVTEPQTGAAAVFTSNGGLGPESATDMKVVASETWGSDTVTPREGLYFSRHALYKAKNYTDTRFSSGVDRPRTVMYATYSGNLLDWDVESYFGMSVFLPSNMEHDTATKNTAQAVVLLALNPNWPSSSHLLFSYYVGGTDTISRWALQYYVGDASTTETGATLTTTSLGLVTDDVGMWTDWIFRTRWNPFATATNPSTEGIPNSKNQTYQGNRGILEVWKNGTKVFSLMNQPLGLVPWTTRDLSWQPRLYKSNWKSFPTSVVGPVYCGIDSIRFGQVVRDSTSYADVNPAGTAPSSGQEPA